MGKPNTPPGPRGWLGVRLPVWRTDPIGETKVLASQYGDVVRYRIVGKAYYQFSHPDACHELLEKLAATNPSSTLPRPSRLVPEWNAELTSICMGQNLGASPTLEISDLRALGESMIRLTRDRIHHGRVPIVNIREVLSDISLTSMAQLILGPGNESWLPALRELVRQLNKARYRRSLAPRLLPVWLPWPLHACLHETAVFIRQMVRHHIQQRLIQQRPLSPDPQGDGWLGRWMRSLDLQNVPFQEDEICHRALTVLLAGHEATATTLTWAAYLLATHPAIQQPIALEAGKRQEPEQIMNEALAAVRQSHSRWNGNVRLSQPGWLTGIRRVLQETLRLHPAVYILAHATREATTVAGYGVPKHTTCLVPVHVMHQDARWFDRPAEFRPERFARPFADQTLERAYRPFGWEAKDCFLQQLVMLGGALVLTTILQRYWMTPVDGFPAPPPDPPFPCSWHPDQGLYLQLHARHRTPSKPPIE